MAQNNVQRRGRGQEFDDLSDLSSQEQDALTFIKKGSLLTKVRKVSHRYRRNFFVDDEGLVLRYRGSQKNDCWRFFNRNAVDQSRISIKQIKEIRDESGTERSGVREQRAETARNAIPRFSLVVGDELRTLDLIAPSHDVQQMWVCGLKYLMRQRASVHPAEDENYWLMEKFREADKNDDGELDKAEIVKLMMSLNVSSLGADFVKDRVRQTRVGEKDFVGIYKELSKREEVDELFQKYAKDLEYMTLSDLSDFFLKEQKQKVDGEEIRKIIQVSEPCPTLRFRKLLSSNGFATMFGLPIMNIKRPRCRTVYQDMTQPLNHYFINSSHNTYLEGHQLRGQSSAEQYKRVLGHRCRCVELDVWDGDSGEPIIYHGYTLTTKILLKDAVAAINECAFKKSEYPVILSIENHCSVDQQRRMADHLRIILGSKLLTEPLPDGSTRLPSPEQLKGKIIVKGKKLAPDVGDGFDGNASSSDDDEAADVEDEEVQRKVKQKPKQKSALALELSDCVVICQAASFKSFEESARKQTFVNISSFGEDKALKLGKEDGGQAFIRHNAEKMSRVYPAGKRTDSSNYNPVPMWNAGCQVVALNYQTRDEPLLVNYGFFEDNGLCGYVLKPEFMRSSSTTYRYDGPHPEEWTQTLTVRVISGFMLPKKPRDDSESILDPFVEVEIYGVPADSQSQKTRMIRNNGFHPIWDETFSFVVTCPRMALVMLRIVDYEDVTRNVTVAQYCLPLRCMQTGYRMVALRDARGETVGPTSLFVHTTIKKGK